MRQNEVIPEQPKVAAEDETGQWRLYEMPLEYSGAEPLYRVYHKHDTTWVSQLTLMAVCAKCRAEAPKEMEGFENLLRWKRHEED